MRRVDRQEERRRFREIREDRRHVWIVEQGFFYKEGSIIAMFRYRMDAIDFCRMDGFMKVQGLDGRFDSFCEQNYHGYVCGYECHRKVKISMIDNFIAGSDFFKCLRYNDLAVRNGHDQVLIERKFVKSFNLGAVRGHFFRNIGPFIEQGLEMYSSGPLINDWYAER